VNVDLYVAGCAGQPKPIPVSSSACTAGSFIGSVLVEPPAVVTAPTCVASATESVTPLAWDGTAHLCWDAPLGGGCGGGGQCAWKPSGAGRLCVRATGDVDCPGGWPDKQVLVTGWSDSRKCSPCICAQPQGAACAAKVSLYASNDCSGAKQVELPSGGPCQNLAASGSAEASLSHGGTPTATCTGSGGQPTGSAQNQDLATLCCAP
jgi:hypothetical protein